MPKQISDLRRSAAHNLVTKSLKIKPGESVIVESWSHSVPVATAVVDEVRRAGGVPLLFLEDESAYWNAVDREQTQLLGVMGSAEKAALKHADAYVMFWGPGDSERFNTLDMKTSDELTAWNDSWYEIVRATGLRGVRMGVGFATESNARQWGTTVDRLNREILEASSVDPQTMVKVGKRLQRSLQGGRHLRIQHANGTDLQVALAGKPSRLHTGVPGKFARNDIYGMMANYPDGRLPFVLDGKTAEGTIRSNLPTWTPWWKNGGGRLEFHDGRLTKYSFKMGQERFRESFEGGTEGRDRAGVLTFGLNPALKNVPSMHQDELGVISLQIGRNIGFGGANHSSFMDWVSLEQADVSVDGTRILHKGKIL